MKKIIHVNDAVHLFFCRPQGISAWVPFWCNQASDQYHFGTYQRLSAGRLENPRYFARRRHQLLERLSEFCFEAVLVPSAKDAIVIKEVLSNDMRIPLAELVDSIEPVTIHKAPA